jgi:SH3-like domain-containing protein
MKTVIKVLFLTTIVLMSFGNASAQSGDTLQLEIDLMGQNMEGEEDTIDEDVPEESVKDKLPAQPVPVEIALEPPVEPAPPEKEEEADKEKTPSVVDAHEESVKEKLPAQPVPVEITPEPQIKPVEKEVADKEKTPGEGAPEESVKEKLPEQPVPIKIAPAPQVKSDENKEAGKREDREEGLFSSIGKTISGWFGVGSTKDALEEGVKKKLPAQPVPVEIALEPPVEPAPPEKEEEADKEKTPSVVDAPEKSVKEKLPVQPVPVEIAPEPQIKPVENEVDDKEKTPGKGAHEESVKEKLPAQPVPVKIAPEPQIKPVENEVDDKGKTSGEGALEESVKENLPAQPVPVKIAPVPQVKSDENKEAGKREDREEGLFSSIGKAISGWFGGENTKDALEEGVKKKLPAQPVPVEIALEPLVEPAPPEKEEEAGKEETPSVDAPEEGIKDKLSVQPAPVEIAPEPQIKPVENEVADNGKTTGKDAPEKGVKDKLSVKSVPVEIAPAPQVKSDENAVAGKREDSKKSLFNSIGKTISGWFGQSNNEDLPAFIQNIEVVEEQNFMPQIKTGSLSTAVLDPTLAIETRSIYQADHLENPIDPDYQNDVEVLSTATLESAIEPALEYEAGIRKEDVDQALKAEESLESDEELEPQEVTTSQKTEVAESQETKHPEETETLSTATLKPAREIETKVQTTEKPLAEQEESSVVSQAKMVVDKQGAEKLKYDRKKDASSVPKNLQVARLEPDTNKTIVHEKLGYACVISRRANLRSGPGKEYPKVAQVKTHTAFQRLNKTGEWIKVKNFLGEMFWIYKSLITKKHLCGTVAQDKVDFYTKPDFSSFPFYGAPVNAGFSVRILSMKNESGWVKVIDSAKNISWVQKSALWIP